jgi:hypothetical protein
MTDEGHPLPQRSSSTDGTGAPVRSRREPSRGK